MNKKQLIVGWGIVLSFLSVGYVYADNQEEVAEIQQQVIERIMSEDLADLNGIQKEAIREIIMEEDPTLSNIERIDLDRNGVNEVIFTYASGAHSSGVKVVMFRGDTAEIIFEKGSSTPNTDFKIINNVPTLIFEESDYTPDYATGERYEETYVWNGKTFIGKNKNFSGSWWAKGKGWTFNLELSQQGDKLNGRYCAVAYNGNRIDCDPQNEEKDNISGAIKNGEAEIIFKSYYSEGMGDRESNTGKAKIIKKGNKLEWIVTEAPKNGYYYCPNRAILAEED